MNNALDTLRKAMRRRSRDASIASVSKDIGTSNVALDEFIYREGDLPEAALHKLTNYAFSGLMKLDLATDTLTSLPGRAAESMNPGPLPTEQAQKPKLSKAQRNTPRGGVQVVSAGGWREELDKLRSGGRPEKVGGIG